MKTVKRPTLEELAQQITPRLPAGMVKPLEKTKCPNCSRLWSDAESAAECCDDDFETYFACPICTKNKRRFTAHSEGVFGDEDDCIKHIADVHSCAKRSPPIPARPRPPAMTRRQKPCTSNFPKGTCTSTRIRRLKIGKVLPPPSAIKRSSAETTSARISEDESTSA